MTDRGGLPEEFKKEAPTAEASAAGPHPISGPINLNDIRVPEEPENRAEILAGKKELEGYEKDKRGLENEDFKQNIKVRKDLANKLFWMVALWLIAIMMIVILQGFGGTLTYVFNLETAVLITLITSSTATVLGMFAIVARYFFSISKK
jgi:hypothetical protein